MRAESLKGHLDGMLLAVLEDGPRHGYAVIEVLRSGSGGRFEPDIRKSGLLAVGAGEVSVTPSGFEQYDSMARGSAAQIVDEHHRDMLIGCKPASVKSPDEACAKQFFSSVGRILYRRPLTDDELKTELAIANAATVKLGNFYTGLALVPLLPLLLPRRNSGPSASTRIPGRTPVNLAVHRRVGASPRCSCESGRPAKRD